MSGLRTYLDHNATSPMRPEVRDAMIAAMAVNGNPSSVHTEGRQARALIDDAREQVGALVGAQADEVVFTSGGSEANNYVLHQSWGSVIVLATEHDSIMTTARNLRAQVSILPVDRSGRGDMAVLGRLMAALVTRDGPMLISIQMANNETGVLQDLGAIRAVIAAFIEANDPRNEDGSVKRIIFHTDAVQALGKIPVDFNGLGVDAMSLSAHKIGGPKGVGALIRRKNAPLVPFIKGGGQEHNHRAGTENVAAIAGFGKACALAQSEVFSFEVASSEIASSDGASLDIASVDKATGSKFKGLRDRLEREITTLDFEGAGEVRIIASEAPRLPNTTAITFPGVLAETQVIGFDLNGIAISAGAACSSGKVGRSRVLEAMQIHDNIADATIRVSLGWNSTDEDVDRFLAAVPRVIGNKSKATHAA